MEALLLIAAAFVGWLVVSCVVGCLVGRMFRAGQPDELPPDPWGEDFSSIEFFWPKRPDGDARRPA